MADHSRVSIGTTNMSCGIFELSSLADDIPGMLYQLGCRLYHPSRGQPVAFIVWSDTLDSNVTHSLIREITVQDLGKIYASNFAENPKTGNFINVITWDIDHTKFKNFYAKERVKRLQQVGA